MVTRGAVLITGAGGFVCSEVAVALAQAGHEVLAVDKAFDAPTRARLAGLTLIEGDLPDALSRVGTDPGTVIHGAAITADPARLGLTRSGHIRRNLDLLTATLDFAGSRGAARFVFLSSMGVFSPADGPAIAGRFTEATLPTADCPYSAAKRAGEIVTNAARDAGFATLSLRLGNIFGPHEAVRETRQHLCLAARMIAEARASGVITVATPDALREWAWLPDLAVLIATLATGLTNGGAPLLHAGTPPAVTDLALARAVAERIPGTTIRIAPPPIATVRPPMGSEHPDALPQLGWTALADALDQLVLPKVPA